MIFGDGIDGKCFGEPVVADGFGRHVGDRDKNSTAVDSSFCCHRYFADSRFEFAIYLASHDLKDCMKAVELLVRYLVVNPACLLVGFFECR